MCSLNSRLIVDTVMKKDRQWLTPRFIKSFYIAIAIHLTFFLLFKVKEITMKSQHIHRNLVVHVDTYNDSSSEGFSTTLIVDKNDFLPRFITEPEMKIPKIDQPIFKDFSHNVSLEKPTYLHLQLFNQLETVIFKPNVEPLSFLLPRASYQLVFSDDLAPFVSEDFTLDDTAIKSLASLLKNKNYHLSFHLQAEGKNGRIFQINLTKSSGLPMLDKKIRDMIKSQTFMSKLKASNLEGLLDIHIHLD